MSSLHQGGISTCLACHTIQSGWHKGEGSESLGIDISWGGRLSPASTPTKDSSGVPGGGTSMVEDTQDLHLLLLDGPSLSLWPQPISLLKWCFLSPPHQWGQLVSLIDTGITFQALFCW